VVLNARIQRVNSALSQQLTQQLQSYQNVVVLVQHLENLNKQLEQNLASRFGASVAQRAMR
jgi:hypothetical protein